MMNVKNIVREENNIVRVVMDDDKEYTRKCRKEKGFNFFIIGGYKFTFDEEMEIVDVKKIYDASIKKSKTNAKKDSNKTNKVEEKKVVEKNKKIVKDVTGKEIRHKEYETIKTCLEANVPVYLTGPAGSGKNYTIKEIAKDLGLEFYFTNSVQQEYKLTGFIDAGGVYHETEFYKAFKNGGLFFLDELDASIPEVLILLNAAIANGYFEFPNGKIDANENFRVIAAGNTVGTGADEQYTGRMVIDSATMDRFVIIEFNYDENVELKIANGDKDLIDFVHSLREQSNKFDMNYIFSYRCIEYITKLINVMNVEKVLTISVFKGMSKDEIRMFNFNFDNKYVKAARKLAA